MGRGYPLGTIIRRMGGYIFEKFNGRLVAQHRLVVERKRGRTLTENERVFHIDGDRMNNDDSNLVVLQFNRYDYHLIKRKIIYMPKKDQ